MSLVSSQNISFVSSIFILQHVIDNGKISHDSCSQSEGLHGTEGTCMMIYFVFIFTLDVNFDIIKYQLIDPYIGLHFFGLHCDYITAETAPLSQYK